MIPQQQSLNSFLLVFGPKLIFFPLNFTCVSPPEKRKYLKSQKKILNVTTVKTGECLWSWSETKWMRNPRWSESHCLDWNSLSAPMAPSTEWLKPLQLCVWKLKIRLLLNGCWLNTLSSNQYCCIMRISWLIWQACFKQHLYCRGEDKLYIKCTVPDVGNMCPTFEPNTD